MVRGGCLKLKYQDDLCRCGKVETEERVLFECNRYGQEQERSGRLYTGQRKLSVYTRTQRQPTCNTVMDEKL